MYGCGLGGGLRAIRRGLGGSGYEGCVAMI